MKIHTLFPEHQQFNIYGKISKLNIDFHHSLLALPQILSLSLLLFPCYHCTNVSHNNIYISVYIHITNETDCDE